jgi:hypothetical protein
MLATIPLAGAGFAIGLFFLLITGMLAAWCFLCFRVGVWLAGGCGMRPAEARANWCAAPNRAAATPEPRGVPCKKHRRPDRPSSAVGMMLVLLLVCLAVFGLKTRSAHHVMSTITVSDRATVQRAEDAKSPTWTVQGHGVTKEDADQIAMEKAYGTILNYIERDMPAPHWTPSADYVARHLVTSRTTTALEDHPETQQTSMKVELKASAYRDILRRGRMLFLSKIVGALILILATIAIYLRLDDLGQGYYTGWLRLGTAVIVTGVIVGLLSLFGVFAQTSNPIATSVEFSSFSVVSLAAIGAVVFLSLHFAGRKA